MPAPSLTEKAHRRQARNLVGCTHDWRLVWEIEFPEPDQRFAECRRCDARFRLAPGEYVNDDGSLGYLGPPRREERMDERLLAELRADVARIEATVGEIGDALAESRTMTLTLYGRDGSVVHASEIPADLPFSLDWGTARGFYITRISLTPGDTAHVPFTSA